jgi:hypothetical protein
MLPQVLAPMADASSHQQPSGAAAWRTPQTTPQSTGARSDRSVSGLAECGWVIVAPGR